MDLGGRGMPTHPKDDEFKKAYESSYSDKEVMEKLGIRDPRSYRRRKRRYEDRNGPLEFSKAYQHNRHYIPIKHHHKSINDFTGTIVIFSDAHFRESEPSEAFSILIQVCKKLKPEYILNNGDAFDGASLSRFPRIGWEILPTVVEELRETKRCLNEIKEASSTSQLLWSVGNHDNRMSTFISNHASMFEGVEGFKLEDHFKDWMFQYSFSFNDTFVVKHRFGSGIHAAYNNVLKSGLSIATGHTHRLMVRPFSDYRGIRYGIECGTIANLYGAQFHYAENMTRDWQSGFVVVGVHEGTIYPELVSVDKGKAFFRGEVITA